MKAFAIEHAANVGDALRRCRTASTARPGTGVSYAAGGSSLVDLMKLNVVEPDVLINLLPLRGNLSAVEITETHLSIGALATMSEAITHPLVQVHAPLIPATLKQAASAQLRNAATIAGNLLQRTRCSYFRDRHSACNKRMPGSGCAAIGGDSRGLAILGTSESCIANFPGDLAVALVALDASVTVTSLDGTERSLMIEDLHRLPGDRPDIETVLYPGDLITALHVPRKAWSGSAYIKVRDRASYAFALSSAAVSLQQNPSGMIDDVRIVLGGLTAKPWRCHGAEAFLKGSPVTEERAWAAAELCVEDARADEQQSFKIELAKRTVVKALRDASIRAQ